MKPIPLDIMATHVAIVGKTGAGKTFTAKGLVERLLDAGRRVIVLDPTGAWWGLRSSADGTSGYPIAIIGGEHGDVPLAEGDAEKVGQWLVDKGASAVIDLSELLLSERHRFVEHFADTIYRANRSPLHLVVDEADEFMPQNPMPECRRMLGNMDRIVRRGRIKGFRVTLITQRPAVLHKNVLTQANTLIAMKLMAPQDRKAIEAWIQGQGDEKAGKEVLSSLAKLKRGEGWVWAPELELLERRTFPAISTFDSSRAPEDGEVLDEPKAAASADVGELRALLAEPEEVAKVGHTYAAPVPDVSVEQLAAEYSRGFDRGAEVGREMGREDGIREAAKRLQEFAAEILAAPPGYSPGKNRVSTPVLTGPEPTPPARMNGHDPEPMGRGKGAEMRVLKVLAQRHPAKFTTAQWATLAILKKSGGTWSTYVSRLKTAGLVERDGDHWRITAAGLKAAGQVPPAPRSGPQVIQMWKDALGGGAARMLDILVAAYPNNTDRANLADRLNMAASGGTFSTYLSRLKSNGLVTVAGRKIKASEALFG